MALKTCIFHDFQPFPNLSDILKVGEENENSVHFFCKTFTEDSYQTQVLYVESYDDPFLLDEKTYNFVFGCIRDKTKCYLPYMTFCQKKDFQEKTRENWEHRKKLCVFVNSIPHANELGIPFDVVFFPNELKNYQICICNSYTDLWNAIQNECIPLYYGPFWHEVDAHVFNSARILFSHEILQNEMMIHLLGKQPVFSVNAWETVSEIETNIKKQLTKILLQPGYQLLENGSLPLSDENLRQPRELPTNPLHLENIEYKNEILMNFYQLKVQEDYDPTKNGRRILLLLAAHVNNSFKFEVFKNNLNFFDYKCMDVIVANTSGLPFNDEVSDICKSKAITYFEIENDKYIDFGKYIFMLGQVQYTNYHTIFFTNDSYILHYPINPYINFSIKSAAELVAFTDSSERCYHYQSYLFSVKRKAIPQFVSFFLDHYEKIQNVKEHHDVIYYYEFGLVNAFTSHDCFLKIADIMGNKGTNVYFHNDKLYSILLNLRIMPITKIKRITRQKEREEKKKKDE